MTTRKSSADEGHEAGQVQAESVDARIARLRKEKELLELELEVNTLRARARRLPDRKEL